MSDFLTRLIERSLVQTPAVQPRIDSVYASTAGMVNAGYLINPEIEESRESADRSPEFSVESMNAQSIDPVTTKPVIDPMTSSSQMQFSAEVVTGVASHIADLPPNTAPRLVSADSSTGDIPDLARLGVDALIDRPRSILVQPQNAAMYAGVTSNVHDPAEDSTPSPPPAVLTSQPPPRSESVGNMIDAEGRVPAFSRSKIEPQIASADRQQDLTIDPSPRSNVHPLDRAQQLVSHSALPVEQSRLEPIATESPVLTTLPVIQVTIGRIEVRATRAAPVVRSPATRTQSALSLDDYLRQRNGGSP